MLLGVLQPFPFAILIDSVFGSKHVDAWQYRLFFHFAPASIPGQVIALAVITLAMRWGRKCCGWSRRCSASRSATTA